MKNKPKHTPRTTGARRRTNHPTLPRYVVSADLAEDLEMEQKELSMHAENLCFAVRLFTENLTEPVRDRLYIERSSNKEEVSRYVKMCEANDALESAIVKIKGQIK